MRVRLASIGPFVSFFEGDSTRTVFLPLQKRTSQKVREFNLKKEVVILASVTNMRIAIEPHTFGDRLHYWRRLRHWSIRELAVLARQAQLSLGISDRPISPAWIQFIERGAGGMIGSISEGRLAALALALDVPMSSLLVEGSQLSHSRT